MNGSSKIEVKANPRCKSCLGSGIAMQIFGPSEMVCCCVAEQLRIVTVPKDPSIPASERYIAGSPEFVDVDGKVISNPQNVWKAQTSGEKPKPSKHSHDR